ncbi:MAG: hypothetical protein GY754_13935 [bacterium]|nr:hypothetical protein [bacterium]
MKIKKIAVWHMDIPLKISFKHTLAERNTSSSILVKVTLDNGVSGFGEALPRDYVTGETVGSSITAITSLVMPRLMGKDFSDFHSLEKEILSLLNSKETASHLTAICAVELALLNALSESCDMNVYQFLGAAPKVRGVRYSMILSAGSEKKIKKHTRLSKLLRIKDLKLKVSDSSEENKKMIKLIRSIYPGANLRVDANCAWDMDSAQRNLEMMDRYNISSCEQPLEKNNIDGLSRLVSNFPGILICVDESLCSFEDAKKIIKKKAATSFNIRISKNGGIINSSRIYNLAQKNGIRCQLGAQVGETAVISSFGRVFAAITGNLLFHEGSFGTRLLEEDITPNKYSFNLFKGKASTKIEGEGIDIPVDEKLVNRFSKEISHN